MLVEVGADASRNQACASIVRPASDGWPSAVGCDAKYWLKSSASTPSHVQGKKYLRSSLLIIDEVGFRQLTRHEASLFFRLVSWRYQKGSTLINTNKAVKDWPEVFGGDEVMVTALLDRLLHKCHVFNIKGRSYRLRELEEQSK